MKTRCPACGATTSLDALLGHSEASQAFLAAINLVGDLAKPMIQYLGMFRSDSRDLTFDRASKLLNELAADINAKQIKRGHHFHAAPKAAWIWAINTIIERRDQGKLQLPFKIMAIYMKCLLHINPNMRQFKIQHHAIMLVSVPRIPLIQKLMPNARQIRLNMNV